MSSIDQLVLFQHKIKKKQNAMDQDPVIAGKVRKSQQMKEQADHLRELREHAAESRERSDQQ